MNKPVRHPEGRFRTVEMVMADVNLCRHWVVRIAKDAGAYIHIGRAVRIDTEKFFDYFTREYRE